MMASSNGIRILLFLLVFLVRSGQLWAQDPWVVVHLNLRDENGNPVPSKDADTFIVSFQMMDFCDNKSGKVCRITELRGNGKVSAGEQKFGYMTDYRWGIIRMEVRHGREKMEVRFHPDLAKMQEHWHLRKDVQIWTFDLYLDLIWSPGYHEVTQLAMAPGRFSYIQEERKSLQPVEDQSRQLDPVLAYRVKWVR